MDDGASGSSLELGQAAFPDGRNLAERERRLALLAAVVETSGESLISVTPDGIIQTWNPAAELLFGHSEAEAIGRDITLIVPERDYSSDGIAGAVLNEGRVLRMRCERIHKSGALLQVSITAAPMRNGAGEIIGVSAVMRDISRILRTEERQKLLMRELAHRGKNLLAVIQSIARHSLTSNNCPPSVRDGFVERIAAMARTYQTLNAEGFEGAKLSELVRLELESFANRVHADGPDVLLRTNEAQTFGLMLHELATNATKHGALSNETGRVDLSWRVIDVGGEPSFAFIWKESGGPPVAPPSRSGFGTTLITSVVEQSFATQPQIDFALGGLGYSFETALAHIGRRLEISAVRTRIRSPRMRAFYDAWSREDGQLPGIDDIAAALRDNADHVTVAEVDMSADPPALKIVSRGKGLASAAKRFDVTFGDKSERDIPGSIEATYRRCARLRQPMYEFFVLNAEEREPLVLERLFAPCSRDGKTVTNVIGMASYSDSE